MSAKDDILGTGSRSNANVPPPIDSSLQGAPGAQGNQTAAPAPAPQPAQAPTPQPTGTDKSQQVTSAPVSSVAAATLQPPPIATPPIASTSSTSTAQPTGTDKPQQQGQTSPSTTPATPASDAEDDYEKKMQGYWDEYKAKRDKNLGDLMATMDKMKDAYKQPTEEELEKERKKRKRDQIFNAIGDGIQALSNLYFTTQYAPNSYNPKNSLSAKAQERYDKIDKEREGNKDKYYNLAYNQYQMQNAADKEDMDWRSELDGLRAKRAATKAKAEADNAAAAAKQAAADRDYDLKKAKQEADAKRADARDAETRRHNRAQESIGRQNAATAAARASGSGGGGGGKTKYTLNIGGKVYTYNSQADYERAVQRYAKGKNLRTMQSVADGTDVYGNPKRKTSAKPISQLAAEVEDAYSEKPKQASFKVGNYKRQPAAKKSTTTKPPLN